MSSQLGDRSQYYFSLVPFYILNILVLWPFQLNHKHKTNSGYKHNNKTHFTLDLTFCMLQHTSSEVRVEQIQI